MNQLKFKSLEKSKAGQFRWLARWRLRPLTRIVRAFVIGEMPVEEFLRRYFRCYVSWPFGLLVEGYAESQALQALFYRVNPYDDYPNYRKPSSEEENELREFARKVLHECGIRV